MKRKTTDDPLIGRRFVVVLGSYDLGGAERQALHLASYLQDVRGARVAVVALFGGLGEQPVRRLCVERRLPCLRVNMPEHEKGVPTFRSVRQFAREMRFFQPDLLLPYTVLPNVLCGIVWQYSGAKASIWNQRDEGRELGFNRWHNLALKNSSHFVSNSRDGVDYLIKQRGLSPESIHLIFNGVELSAPKRARAEVFQGFGLPASGFLAVMLANITRYKDHPTLVKAWKIVCERLSDLEPLLVLAGRKDESESVENLIRSLGLEKGIKLVGVVSDVPSLLRAANLAVFSTRVEGTPNAVLESMLAERAVVATDITGSRDALGDDYSELVPPRDAEALAQRIIALARDPDRRAKLGKSLARRAKDQFTVRAMCEKTCSVIEGALLQNHNPIQRKTRGETGEGRSA